MQQLESPKSPYEQIKEDYDESLLIIQELKEQEAEKI